MNTKIFYVILFTCLAGITCRAEDITTLDGQKYENVSDLKVRPDSIFFLVRTEGSVKGVKIPFDNLPDDLKKKYNYDPYEGGLYLARQNRPMNLTISNAFRLATLKAAKKKAREEHKLIGFIMVWDSMFQPGEPMGSGGPDDLAGFYKVFNKSLVLVFVRHEDELDKVPDAVKKGFFGPDEGGWAPNMAVVTEDCSQFICEVPLGGDKSNGYVREQIFRKKIAEIKKFVADRDAAKNQTK